MWQATKVPEHMAIAKIEQKEIEKSNQILPITTSHYIDVYLLDNQPNHETKELMDAIQEAIDDQQGKVQLQNLEDFLDEFRN